MADVKPGTLVANAGEIAMVNPLNGVTYSIPAGQLQAELEKGARVASPVDTRETYLKQEYGNAPIQTALEGVARVGTFGLSDAILPAIGVTSQEGLRERRARDPIAATGGEVLGALTPWGAPALAARGGGAVAAGLGGGMLARGAGLAAEGAAFGTGMTVSEVALSKDPLTAEAIAGSLAHNVLFGGAAAVGGGALAAGATKLAGLVTKGRQAAEAGVEAMAAHEAGAVARAASAEERAAIVAGRDAELARLTAEAQEAAPQMYNDLRALRVDQVKFRKEMKPTLSAARAEGAAGKAEPTLGILDASGVPIKASVLDDIAVSAPGKKRAPADVITDLQRAERRLASAVGDVRKSSFDPPRALDAVSDYNALLTKAFGANPPERAAGMISRSAEIRDRLVAMKTPSSSALAEAEAKIAAFPTKAELKAAETAAAAEAKLAQAAAAPKEMGLGGAALGFGLEKALGGLGIPGAGMITGLMMGKAMGGGVGGKIAAAVRVRAEEVGRKIGAVVDKLTGAPGRGLEVAAGRVAAIGANEFSRLREAVLRYSADPAGFQRQANERLNALRLAGDPVIADQVMERITKAFSYMADMMPKSPEPGPSLTPDRGPLGQQGIRGSSVVATGERDRWLKRVSVALNPEVLLHELAAGTLTPTTMATAEAVHPETVALLRQQLMQTMGTRPVEARFRVPLAILMGPQAAGFNPAQVASSQARMNQEMAGASRPANLAQSNQQGPKSTASQTRTAEDVGTAATAGQRHAGASPWA